MSKAEELIDCLEGEIAKRDETIARLEPQLNRAIQANYDLREELAACRVAVENCELFRAELSALKAQEPVAELLRGQSAIGTWFDLNVFDQTVPNGTKLYAAPVSEAKAQGVVQWPEADEIMQMAFEEGQPADDASGYCFELEEFDLFIERLMSDVARLNAAPVQQVSVPDASTDFSQFLSAVMDAAGLVRHGRRSKELSEYLGSKCMEYRCFAAPEAPAADVGLVEALDYQALFDAIAAATSVYANGAINISVQAFRDALAAHRDQGAAKC